MKSVRDFPTVSETYVLRSMMAGDTTTVQLGLRLEFTQSNLGTLLGNLKRKGLVRMADTSEKLHRWELTQLGERCANLARDLDIAKIARPHRPISHAKFKVCVRRV